MRKSPPILTILFITVCLTVIIILKNKNAPPSEPLQVTERIDNTKQHSEESIDDQTPLAKKENIRIIEDHISKHEAGCDCPEHGSAVTPAKVVVAVKPSNFVIDEVFMENLLGVPVGGEVNFPLSEEKEARGTVTSVTRKHGQVVSTQGLLEAPEKGSFYFRKQQNPGKAGDYIGIVSFDEGEVAYRVETQDDGSARLTQMPIGKVQCHNYQAVEKAEIARAPSDHPEETTSPNYQNDVPRLQSLPGATAVLYLDFDGQKWPVEGWAKVKGDVLPSELTKAQRKEAWQYVAENFAPFNINVTTDLAVYLAAPENSRQRCIHSRSSPASSGVAFVGSFNWGGDVPCWVGYTNRVGFEVMCHELGHTLKLHHDGRVYADGSKQEYFGGHGPAELKWAPIMGSATGAKVGQWSKGEYALANRTNEDDLAIIAEQNNNTGYRTDDHGKSFAESSHLEILPDNSASQRGVIETREDFDSFRFTTTAAGSVTLKVEGATVDSNLDILAEIVDSTGTVIASENPDLALGPVTLTQNLAAGDYLLRVSGVGRGDPLTDGYTDYGSLGYYKVSGTVPNSVAVRRFDIAENSANGTTVGTVVPIQDHGSNTLTFAITSGNTPAAFQIDPNTGAITVANGALLDFEAPGAHYDNPSQFELFVSVTDATDSSLNEVIRVVITVKDENESPTLASIDDIKVLEHTPVGTILHEAKASDPDYLGVLTYAITSGNDAGYFAISDTGKITIAADIPATTPASVYNLTITVTDSGIPAMAVTETVGITVIKVEDSQKANIIGSISQTNYLNVTGNSVSDLEASPKFPHTPDSIHVLNEFRAVSGGNNFGGAIRGFIIPPVSGDYTFWISGDDSAKLWLSTDDSPDNLEQLAYCNSHTQPDQWDKFTTQKSVVKTLVAGKAYFVKALYKEVGGGDHASVAWQGPEISREVIPGRFMAPYFADYRPFINTPTPALTVREDAYNGHTVGKVEVIDFNTEETHSQFTIIGGNANGAFSIDATTGVISVANKAALTAGSSIDVEISVTDSGSTMLSISKTITISVDARPPVYAGRIYKEIWRGISGDVLTDLTTNSKYPDSPTEVKEYNTLDHGASIGNQYGARIRAYVIPSVSGVYRFWIASNEQARLLMSTDENASGAVQIAWNPRWTISNTGANQWIRDINDQRSAERTLEAGQKYYTEVVHKKGAAGNDLRVGWTGPGMSSPTIIGGANLEAYSPNALPTWNAPAYAFTTHKNALNGTAVGTVSATDADSANLLYNILSGNDAGAFAIDYKTGQITVKDRSALVTGPHLLQIGVQDDYLSKQYFFGESTITATIQVSDNDGDNDLLDDAWEIAQFGNITGFSATDDPDGDGLSNFSEMAFGGNPLLKDAISVSPKVTSLNQGGTEMMEYRYRRPKNHATLNIVYKVKVSSNLKTWSDIMEEDAIQRQVESSATDDFEWVVYKVPTSASNKIFVKTEVLPSS